MQTIRKKWNERYENIQVPNPVIDVLELNLHLLPKQGKSLDLACGLGGNALRMAELGLTSHAWDLSDMAINKVTEFAQERHLILTPHQCDINELESQNLMISEGFDVIIVSHFLLREIIPALINALNSGGLIYYQTFIEPEEISIELVKNKENIPKNNKFRLQKNELLTLFSGLTLRYYREDGVVGNLSKGVRNEAMLVAQKE
jgi:2-polyprenyl-3-methyl-5-hydroxy-6-metoxy-1,4-benzoquinol methylase